MARPVKNTDTETLFIRMPSELKRQLQESADNNDRTLQQQTIYCIREYLNRNGTKRIEA